MTDCEQLKENYDAYALGVLEGEERAELEAHLDRECPACTRGVAEARALVAQLAYASPEADPPGGLREAVLDSVSPRPRALFPGWVWAAAAALLLFSFYTAMETRRIREELARAHVELATQRARTIEIEAERQRLHRFAAVVSAPGTRKLSLKPDPSNAGAPEIRAAWNESLGLAIAADHLPAPASGHVFQLWVVPKNGAPISAGVFAPEKDGKLIAVSRPSSAITLAEAAALAVTEEPAGGVAQPTTKPIWVGKLS